jgi:N-acetylglucosamine-6-phosphate deacetylase
MHAISALRLFDGHAFHDRMAVLVDAGRIVSVLPLDKVPAGIVSERTRGLLVPGFVDAQVNGGGGVLLNDAPGAAAMAAIAAAHRPFGTTAILPTLITDRPAAVTAAIAAAVAAVARGSGVAGLHLEGPHLAPARKGTHLADLMRPMSGADLAELAAAARALPALLLTLAPEQVTPEQVRALVAAGATVSLGHSDCTMGAAMALFAAGATGATHLFNAMSGLGHRAPGLVGAVLESPQVWAGIIADGVHADPAALRIALRAKRGPGRLFLVTDAMALVGSDRDSLVLNGRTIRRHGVPGAVSRLTLEDGTLAGSDLDMATALRLAVQTLEVPLDEALRMASLYPATFLRLADRGRIAPGFRADMALLDTDLRVTRCWVAGG